MAIFFRWNITIAQSVQRLATDFTNRGSNPVIVIFSKESTLDLRLIQPPVKWLLETFPRIKWPGRDADLPPSSGGVKNEWSHTSYLPIRLHIVDKENFHLQILSLLVEYRASMKSFQT